MKNIYRLSFLFFFLLVSCVEQYIVKSKNTYPDWKSVSKLISKDHQLIINIGDFSKHHKVFQEYRLKKDDQLFPSHLSMGGFKIRKRYLEIIKERLPKNSLVLSASDHYHHEGHIKGLPLDALKYPLSFLKKSSLIKKRPWVNSNILNIQTGQPENFSQKSQVKILSNSAQILSINDTTLLKNLSSKSLLGLYFQDGVTTLLKNRHDGLNILLYHGETKCSSSAIKSVMSFSKASKKLSLNCPKGDALLNLIERLPHSFNLSLIISTRKSSGVGFVKDIPVLFSGLAETMLHPILIHKDDFKKSYVLPSLKMCHHFFKATQDCHYRSIEEKENDQRLDLLKEKGFDLVPAKFLGIKVI